MNAVTVCADIESATLDELDEEIRFLMGHVNAGQYRLLELVGELAARPFTVDYKSVAHYLNHQCGIAMGAAREKVRTALKLRELPKTRAAFRAGRLSYSKVRALTRVATEDNEDGLLNMAFYGTATHLERVVREYRQVEATFQPAEIVQRRNFTTYWDDDGMLVCRGRLPPDQGAALLKALEHAAYRPKEGASDDVDAAAQDAGSAEPADASEADTMIGTVADGGVAAELVADDPYGASRADGLARLAESFLETKGGSSHTADRYQVQISVSAETLIRKLPPRPRPRHPSLRVTRDAEAPPVNLVTAAEDVARLIESGTPLAAETLERLTCDGSLVAVIEDAYGMPLSVGRKTRTLPVAISRALLRRDGGCRFPGCVQTRHVDGHHIVHWSKGGETKLANLVSLCRHHHTALHEGGCRIETHRDDFVFLDPRGEVLLSNGDRRSRGNVAELFADNAARGIAIDAETAAGGWDGDPVDYDHVLFVLFQHLDHPMTPPDLRRQRQEAIAEARRIGR